MSEKNMRDAGKHSVLLLVRYATEFRLEGLYLHALQLSFVPTVGMQFIRSGVNSMWSYEGGEVVPPLLESVLYDLDGNDKGEKGEGLFVCSFTVDKPLESAFWQHIPADDIYESGYADYILMN